MNILDEIEIGIHRVRAAFGRDEDITILLSKDVYDIVYEYIVRSKTPDAYDYVGTAIRGCPVVVTPYETGLIRICVECTEKKKWIY